MAAGIVVFVASSFAAVAVGIPDEAAVDAAFPAWVVVAAAAGQHHPVGEDTGIEDAAGPLD